MGRIPVERIIDGLRFGKGSFKTDAR